MKHLINYFLKGLLVFVPVALTVFTIILVFTKLDGLLRIPIPGLGLVLTLALITLIGFLASNFLGNKFFALIDKLFTKLPVVKMLYSAFKDLIGAFAGEKKSFDKPAIVELTPGGPKALGFITRDGLDFLSLSEHVAVYFPQSYNFAGSVLMFPSKQVVPVNIDSSEAMTFVVSGGVSGK
ncbi:MAG: DUF502 domain-containing protein [Sedimentisphaerales bacterium]|nr:DUF502 domain-containing protein [Sedimentisphaerales bacterium]